MPDIRPATLSTRLITSQLEWAQLEDRWAALHAVSPTSSTPLSLDWLTTWWRVYGPALERAELQIITVWRGTEMVGAVPLYAHSVGAGPFRIRRLGFISTGEAEFEETCADYLNLLHQPDDGEACAGLVWDAISRLEWDHLELVDLPSSSPLLLPAGQPPQIEQFSLGTCPVADLSGGFEAYLQRLSSNRRQQIRRLLRDGERLSVGFELVSEETMSTAFEDLVRLHQARWTAEGSPGVFAAPKFVEFHRRLLDVWLPSGRSVLATLGVGGDTVAVLYGFITGTKFDFYQSGVRFETAGGELSSPGTLAHLLLMKALAARGITAYDFLRGPSVHKERHATAATELVGIRAWRPTVAAGLYRSTNFAGKVVRKGLQRAKRVGSVPRP